MKISHIAQAITMLALAAMATPSGAQTHNDAAGWYGGVNLGRSRATIDDARIRGSLVGDGFTVDSLTDDDRSTGFKVFGGYRLNRYFSLEGGAFSLGEFGYQAVTTPAGTLNGRAKIRGLNLDVVGTLPVFGHLSAFARGGLTYAESRDAFRSTGMVVVNNPDPRERSANWKAGLGLQYAFTPALSVRAEIERYRINDAVGNKGDISMASIGLVYRFGADAATPRVAAASPAPAPAPARAPAEVAAVPAPAPQPAPAPIAVLAPVSEKVTFASDALFDFDVAMLKPAGEAKLDELAARQQGMTLEAVIATGHTDSVGTEGYNDRLSVRRAEAVKSYLVSRGTEASRVFVEGKGERQPIADNATVEGRAQNRRVQIEVVGTRTR